MFNHVRDTISNSNISQKASGTFFFLALVLLIIEAHFIEWICSKILGEGCEVEYFDPTYSLGTTFFLTVVFAPLIETFVFQYLPSKLFFLIQKKWTIDILLLVLFSSITFGFSHNYNIFTIIDGTFAGLLFIVIFLKFESKNSFFNGYWATFLIHSFYNSYAFFINNILG